MKSWLIFDFKTSREVDIFLSLQMSNGKVEIGALCKSEWCGLQNEKAWNTIFVQHMLICWDESSLRGKANAERTYNSLTVSTNFLTLSWRI